MLIAQLGRTASATVSSASIGPVTTRRVGRTGQTLTALGLGTFLTYDLNPGDRRDALREVLRRYVAGGGRLIDTSPLSGSAEVSVGAFLSGMPEEPEVFIANKIWSTEQFLGNESHALASLERSRLRIWRSATDLMQCHSLTNAAFVIPLLQAWERERLIRHVGITHMEAIPGFDSIGRMPWYPGKDGMYQGLIRAS
jgi:diketogulonate reductase-like aldo/keto reductase